MQYKIKDMNKAFYLIPIIFGLGLAAMTYPLGLIHQELDATYSGGSSSEEAIANPSGLPQSNMTGPDNITSANPVGDDIGMHKDNPT